MLDLHIVIGIQDGLKDPFKVYSFQEHIASPCFEIDDRCGHLKEI